jgi:hypothetical protein
VYVLGTCGSVTIWWATARPTRVMVCYQARDGLGPSRKLGGGKAAVSYTTEPTTRLILGVQCSSTLDRIMFLCSFARNAWNECIIGGLVVRLEGHFFKLLDAFQWNYILDCCCGLKFFGRIYFPFVLIESNPYFTRSLNGTFWFTHNVSSHKNTCPWHEIRISLKSKILFHRCFWFGEFLTKYKQK